LTIIIPDSKQLTLKTSYLIVLIRHFRCNLLSELFVRLWRNSIQFFS